MSGFVALWRFHVGRSVHRWSSLLVAVTGVVGLCSVEAMMGAPPVRGLGLFPFVVAGVMGSIGTEASSGRLPLLLVNPVTRSTWVLAHWAASATIATGWALLSLACEAGVLAAEGRGVYAPWAHAMDRAAWCAGAAAVLTCLSTRLPSWGHLAAWYLLLFAVSAMEAPAGAASSPALEVSRGLLLPALEVHGTFDTSPVTWSHVAGYVAKVSGWLLLGVLLFRNREVSYATR